MCEVINKHHRRMLSVSAPGGGQINPGTVHDTSPWGQFPLVGQWAQHIVHTKV